MKDIDINIKLFDPKLISIEIADNLRQSVLFDQQYLGSSIYEYMFGQYDDKLYHVLFDGHSKNIYESIGQRPSIILGRRGSGKSTYLNHLSQKDNVIPLGLKIWDMIDLVESQVEDILNRQKTIDAEKVSDIWHLIFMTLASVEATKQSINNSEITTFLRSLPIGEVGSNSLVQVASKIIEKLKSVYIGSKDNFDIEICLDAITASSTTLDMLEKTLSDTLSNSDKVIVFMLDNPERFTREEIIDLSKKSQYEAREKTISGLLNLSGRINKGNIGIQLRLCIPSEQYFYLKKVSSSKKKDFNATQILHWKSGDILSMAAHRYLVFLTVYPEYRDDITYIDLVKLPIYSRNGSIQFWNNVLGSDIKNGRKVKEDVLTYLLRHTQLVPRQLLDYLNRAVNLSIKDGCRDLTKLAAIYVKNAIEEVEYDISSEVIDAYSYSYPEANEIFDVVLPKLPILTTAKEIKDDLYKTTDAKAVLKRNSNHPQVIQSKERFLRLLVETGVYGKVSQTPKERSMGYVEAEFEYTIHGSMRVTDSDQLAMHPLFSGNISPVLYSMLEDNIMGVYPIGTDCKI